MLEEQFDTRLILIKCKTKYPLECEVAFSLTYVNLVSSDRHM